MNGSSAFLVGLEVKADKGYIAPNNLRKSRKTWPKLTLNVTPQVGRFLKR